MDTTNETTTQSINVDGNEEKASGVNEKTFMLNEKSEEKSNNFHVLRSGLECLESVDKLTIFEERNMLEHVSALEVESRFEVKLVDGERVYRAIESSHYLQRCFCGSSRSLHVKIYDNFQREVIRICRPLRCSLRCCCLPFCSQKIKVYSKIDGREIGSVKQRFGIFGANFKVKGEDEKTMLRISGPCLTFSCFGTDVKFRVLSADGDEIGEITKVWGGLRKEIYSEADNFSVAFPVDLHVNLKALLLAAAFLIDFMYFE